MCAVQYKFEWPLMRRKDWPLILYTYIHKKKNHQELCLSINQRNKNRKKAAWLKVTSVDVAVFLGTLNATSKIH